MAALTKDRNTKRRDGIQYSHPMAAAIVIYAGSLVVNNASGYAAPGTTATGLTALGVAEKGIANPGAAGEQRVDVRRGVYQFANSASTDEITRADIGKSAYIVDDQTVAKTSATNTRSVAGVIRDVDSAGVWIEV